MVSDCRARMIAHMDEKLRIVRHSYMDNSLMRLPSDFYLKKKLDLCGVYEKYLGMGSILEIVVLKDGRHYPIANPFIEGERLLQIRGI
jgi:hypothetical protein